MVKSLPAVCMYYIIIYYSETNETTNTKMEVIKVA